MSDIKTLLSALKKIGYPTSSFKTICFSIDYNCDNFTLDLVEYFGENGAEKFINKAIESLETNEGYIRIPLTEYCNECYSDIVITNIHLDLDNQDDVSCELSIIEAIIPNSEQGGELVSLMDFYENMDMGDWDNYTLTIDDIRETAYRYIFERTGISLLWE